MSLAVEVGKCNRENGFLFVLASTALKTQKHFLNLFERKLAVEEKIPNHERKLLSFTFYLNFF